MTAQTRDCTSIPWSGDGGMLTTRKWSTWPKKSWSSNWGAWRGQWANLSTASWYWIDYIISNRLILIKNLDYIMLTLTNDISRLSVWSGISFRPCITSPPSSWCTQPYWTNGNWNVISFWMTEIYVSKHVAKMAMRVVQRDFERVSNSGLGESRTYNGSRLLKLVTGLQS